VILISLGFIVFLFLISYFCFYCCCRAFIYMCCSSFKENSCLRLFLCACLACKRKRRQSQTRIQKSPVSSKSSLFKKFGRNKSNTESKYTLLSNMDNESIQFKGNSNRKYILEY
jgi:hypothetical protein